MSHSYQKLLFILTISTILIFKTTTFTIASDKINSGYFYTKNYEGYAGYCAVITPALEEVSNRMTKVLNINKMNPKNANINYSNTLYNDQKKQVSKIKNETFSTIIADNYQTTTTTKKNDSFENLYSYIKQKD
tara:strand:+ start:1840 stop:2238 length:399 start_codon:yes stop_codon:yes gene_type:complete